ncbi:gliding motility protein GldM [Sungkyunkwania multivorans]|uniref:Gliding motility protein GldM n=1 Tax=Sungkyunkwania multivorans TaxID=1173618 RepID=A0ABW3D405_9FLAO
MAGGQSPRQKMINLMYLVFIAMLALNMSKEVLGAFGIMNEKFERSNTQLEAKNELAYDGLSKKASDSPEKYGELNQKAAEIKSLSADLVSYIEEVKNGMVAKIPAEERTDYQVMDQADYLDQRFFKGDNYTKEGQEFVNKIQNYRQKVSAVLDSFPQLKNTVIDRFSTGDDKGKVKNRDGRPIDWLDYNYKGYPMIASLTKLTALQSDVKSTEDEVLNAMLGGKLEEEVSMKNYSTLLQQPKSAYYPGETFDGSVVLGRTDNSTKPNEVELTLDGRKLEEGKDYELQGGQVKFKFPTGRPGDHKLEGKLIFNQGDGEPIEVLVDNKFAVITKPNAAVISADKMNVVYRGVSNPMTISIPGIPDNRVSASASGLSRASGSKYIMRPKTGREVTITASGTLPDGQRISTSSKFRIKDIPRPVATIRGEPGNVKMPRKNLEIATVGAILEDFDFDIKLAVGEFKFKVPGQPTVVVRGRKLDSRAKSALKRAKRGDIVQIYDVKASISGNSGYRLKKVSPVAIELTN